MTLRQWLNSEPGPVQSMLTLMALLSPILAILCIGGR